MGAPQKRAYLPVGARLHHSLQLPPPGGRCGSRLLYPCVARLRLHQPLYVLPVRVGRCRNRGRRPSSRSSGAAAVVMQLVLKGVPGAQVAGPPRARVSGRQFAAVNFGAVEDECALGRCAACRVLMMTLSWLRRGMSSCAPQYAQRYFVSSVSTSLTLRRRNRETSVPEKVGLPLCIHMRRRPGTWAAGMVDA